MTDNTNTITCSSATSPIDINMNNIMGPCVLKCDYNYEYGIYSPNITNNRSYLSLNYSGKSRPVKYNDSKYDVQTIRIYQPSLHTYNGVKADGEIFILHNGPGKNLIVSIPIKVGGKTDKGSTQLASVITEAALRTPNDGESVTYSLGNFSLDNFIPNKKGFFSYTGTLPFDTCNGTYSYVIYNIDDSLQISHEVLNKLKQITRTTVCDTKENISFYNKHGANTHGQDLDNIYIDCQPVNEEGELMINEGQVETRTNTIVPSISSDKVDSLLTILAIAAVSGGIIFGGWYIIKKLRSRAATTST
jgi:carbonic anhydrase